MVLEFTISLRESVRDIFTVYQYWVRVSGLQSCQFVQRTSCLREGVHEFDEIIFYFVCEHVRRRNEYLPRPGYVGALEMKLPCLLDPQHFKQHSRGFPGSTSTQNVARCRAFHDFALLRGEFEYMLDVVLGNQTVEQGLREGNVFIENEKGVQLVHFLIAEDRRWRLDDHILYLCVYSSPLLAKW